MQKGAFEITPVPFAFKFESEEPNGNSATKQSRNYHSSDLDKVGQTEPEAYRMHAKKRPVFLNKHFIFH